jgi:hypothetical protein
VLDDNRASNTPLDTQAFQFPNTGKRHLRFLSVVLIPLFSDPPSQLSVFAAVPRNIAVPVCFAVVGKLPQTVFPGGVADVDPHSKSKLSNAWIRKVVICDPFPSNFNLYCCLCVETQRPSLVFSLYL